MVINTNVASLASQRHLASSRAEMEQAMERLSSGKRINSAMDDAAGLTIAHSLDGKIAGLNQAVRNANDGIAFINLAEGALEEVSSMLTRMQELATQAANGTYSTSDRANLNKEFEQLTDEITRISENTFFNGVNVINTDATMSFQVGDTSSDQIQVSLQRMGAAYIGASDNLSVTPEIGAKVGNVTTFSDIAVVGASDELKIRIGDTTFTQSRVEGGDDTADQNATLNALRDQINTHFGSTIAAVTAATSGNSNADGVIKITTTLTVSNLDKYSQGTDSFLSSQDITTADQAIEAITSINKAIQDVDSFRATLGATANRMEHASTNLMSRVEHQSAARSRIQDADYAVESANLAKAQVLQQAGTAMLSQANASTQNVLSLLK
jgi:flagellin